MARQAWVAQLRNAQTTAEQIASLKALKNEIVGHPARKDVAVREGILEPVVRLSLSKVGSRRDGKAHDHTFAPRPLSEEEMLRLQGLQVLASVALGGPSFLAPLQSTSSLSAVLSNLCPSNNPSQLVLASLRALTNLAKSTTLVSPIHTFNTSTIAEALFSRQHISSLYRILSQSSSSSLVQSQISLAASLISQICREERHQQSLANAGILDALATKLASFVVAGGLVIPRAEVHAQKEGLKEFFPEPAPLNANLAIILEAIAVIINDSKFRASQLLYSPSILAVFPFSHPLGFAANKNARAAWNAFNTAGLSVRQSQLNAMDYLLPWVPLHQVKNTSAQASAFPPLGSSNSSQNLAINGRSGAKYTASSLPSWTDSPNQDSSVSNPESPTVDSEEPESPLIAYLILLLKIRTGVDRLMAAWVLIVLYRAGLANKTRETGLGLLVVPLLVRMLGEDPIPLPGNDSLEDEEAISLDQTVKERAPAVLAMLITDSEYLQKCAYDASVVSKLSKLLKVSYDPVIKSAGSRSWSPYGDGNGESLDVQSTSLGPDGLPSALVHKIKVRECVLKAIAALVPFKDEYRKAIVDEKIMPYIVASMSVKPQKPSPMDKRKPEKPVNEIDGEVKDGYGTNPVQVLIAACGAVRALSRSVSILRTTLIDNGVAEPLFSLLQYPDIEVQIAATAAICNLVTDVSPMREVSLNVFKYQYHLTYPKPISEAGVLKILCEHAHSTNAKLRLNALWALKHFVHGVSNDMKRQCLEELGQGWLVQLICDDTEDEALLNSRDRSEKDSPQSDAMDEDVVMGHFEDQVDTAFGNSFGHPTSRPSSRGKSVQQAEARLAALREAETNPIKKARQDDIAVQEQGLDFIRNLIGGQGQGGTAETTEMIDFLFSALGQDRVFEILASKLKPKLINPYVRGSPNTERKILPPQAEIIIAVCYILVHMAASVPRHRQLIIAQTDLLKLFVPQFNHPNIEVRLSLCWLVTNLTWMDDDHDGSACAQRANELQKLGFLSKIEMLLQDPELNVRERAKQAMYQFHHKP